MSGWLDPSRWRGRWFSFLCAVAGPFVGFLVSHEYPPARIEAMAALLCLVAAAGALALPARRIAFGGLLVVCLIVVCAVPAQRLLAGIGRVPLPAVCIGLALVLGTLIIRAPKEVPFVLGAFAVATLAAHAVVSKPAAAQAVPCPVSARPGHILYLVLDEHMSPDVLAGICDKCRVAADSARSVLERFSFTIYPNAYSNYPTTLESLPSLLNRRMSAGEHSPLPDANGVHHVDARRFFSHFRSRGFDLSVTESRGIRFVDGVKADVSEYWENAGKFADTDLSTVDKFRLLVGMYQISDPLLYRAKGFFPFRFGGPVDNPLYAGGDWPERLFSRIDGAPRPTLFFAHLMIPHAPYALRADGTVRPLDEWVHDCGYDRLDRVAYADRYERYAGQVEYVQSQLRRLLERIEAAGFLEPMTVVIHGDHGSRIRRRDVPNVDLSAPPVWRGSITLENPRSATCSTASRRSSRSSSLTSARPPSRPGRRASFGSSWRTCTAKARNAWARIWTACSFTTGPAEQPGRFRFKSYGTDILFSLP